jgi:hypothetical protein
MEKIMSKTNRTSKLSLEDRTLADVELKVVTGGFAPVTHLFLQTHDKREAHNENVA